ncbi:MAG: hypothetical protein HC919_03165 [Oscillatoriales cyanobacterium SM2_2_1]|nr:hypothetical protein [Oscillatoriales cyanobacterium SM2_2_1]
MTRNQNSWCFSGAIAVATLALISCQAATSLPGRYELDTPEGRVTVIITADQRLLAVNPADENDVIEVEFRKVSEDTTLPQSAQVKKLPTRDSRQTSRRESSARNTVGALNRGQQAYYLEFQRFAPQLAQLQLGIKDDEFYRYVSEPIGEGAVQNTAIPLKPDLKVFVGIVAIVQGNLDSRICVNAQASAQELPRVNVPTSTPLTSLPACPPGYEQLP